MGLRNLPSKSWTINRSWVLAANIAADLQAWTRLLGLHDQPDLVDGEPETLRYRLLHLPAKLTAHARRRWFAIAADWPWAEAFLLCWQRLSALPQATRPGKTVSATRRGPIGHPVMALRTRSDTRRSRPQPQRTKRSGRISQEGPKPSEESRSTTATRSKPPNCQRPITLALKACNINPPTEIMLNVYALVDSGQGIGISAPPGKVEA
jgi:hypothetical protein